MSKPAAAAAGPPVWRPLRTDFGRMFICCALTVGLMLWTFPPYALWPAAFVCLAPWAVAVCTVQRAWVIHWGSLLAGWSFYLIAIRWLYPVTDLGYMALGLYLAIYWPLAAWAVRAGLRHRLSPIWILPTAWVATEYLRAWVMSGFPWFFIGHGLHDQSLFVQIADATGVYGVSFVAVLVAAVLAEAYLQRRRRPGQPPRYGQLRIGAGIAAVVVALTLAYGWWRVGQARDWKPGPRVAVVQEFYPLQNRPPYQGASILKVFADYIARGADALLEQPDLVVFPETAWGAIQNREFLEIERNAVDGVHASAWIYGEFCDAVLRDLASGDFPAVNRRLSDWQRHAAKEPFRMLPNTAPKPAPLVVGTMSIETFPKEVYPATARYNSALVYDPKTGQRAQRYDKIHLVPFGELVPFRQARWLGIDFHWLYRWLNNLSPFSEGKGVEYTLTPGTISQTTPFTLRTPHGDYRFAIPICYEDTVPYISRGFVYEKGVKRVDFLVNISNDGWFHMKPPAEDHSAPLGALLRWWTLPAELPQHLAICQFRAIENRVPIARSVNTGISAFIDPNGRVFAAVEKDGRRWGRDVVGHRVAQLPLDPRVTLYGRFGDWFASLCLISGAALWAEAVIARWVLAIRRRWRRRVKGTAGS